MQFSPIHLTSDRTWFTRNKLVAHQDCTFDESAFVETASEAHPAGEKDDHAFTFRTLDRR